MKGKTKEPIYYPHLNTSPPRRPKQWGIFNRLSILGPEVRPHGKQGIGTVFDEEASPNQPLNVEAEMELEDGEEEHCDDMLPNVSMCCKEQCNREQVGAEWPSATAQIDCHESF